MDRELVDSIQTYVASDPSLRLLGADEGEELRRRVADHFGLPEGHKWWWQHLKSGVESLAYEGDVGLQRLRESIPPTVASAMLFITDDEVPPWVCVAGAPTNLIALLEEQRFCEYFVVSPSMEWIVFDTHHNNLVATGAISLQR